MARWMIYGASGYSGGLLAERAVAHGERPVLAGRAAERLYPVARRLGLEACTVTLRDAAALAGALEDVDAVVHCAGPFSQTCEPMLDACLATRTHYLDITGEIDVFELVLSQSEAARERGIALLPGVGFDVVPTDCLAARLAQELPDADELTLAFRSAGGRPSAGTTQTVGEALGGRGRARIQGVIETVPLAWRTREIPYPTREALSVSIPWGDVSTAWYSTGIPNITVYMAAPESFVKWMRRADAVRGVLRLAPVQRALKAWARRWARGPSAGRRQAAYSEVWGEVRRESGESIVGALTTPEGYSLTAESALAAVQKVLAGAVEPGAWTPAQAFGCEFIDGLTGVTIHPLVRSSRAAA